MSRKDSLQSNSGEGVRLLEARELEMVTGGIAFRSFTPVPAEVVFCPPPPPPSIHIDPSQLAGLAQG
jgi:hypothetical protein